MKVSKVQITPMTKKLSELKNKRILASVTGDYKTFKSSSKEFASLAVKNYEAAKNAPCATVKNIPLFSKYGLKIIKVWFLNLFRIKTPDEKLLSKMVKEDKAKQFILNKSK